MRVWPGRPYPLGATWDGAGVNFALFSEHATKVELCLFDSPDADQKETAVASRCPSRPTRSGTATCPTSCPASSTATASTGRTNPAKGHRFNPNKVLLDPYAKAIGRDVKWDDRCSATRSATTGRPVRSTTATARRSAPLAAVVDTGVHLGRRPAAAHALAQDAHLRAARQGLHQAASRTCRRSCAAPTPAWPPRPAIEHLHDWASRRSSCCRCTTTSTTAHLVEKGLTNYWGYNTLAFFAPHLRYASTAQPAQERCSEFKMMVRALHAAGIEVILDVVYNHTAEGNQTGADAVVARHRQRQLLPPVARGPALLHGLHRLRQHAQHARTRACCSSSWTACATGCWRCTSTASASIWPARWPASCTRSTGWAPSSTSSTRTRSSRR